MKKLITIFIAAVLITACALSFTVSGAETPFKVEITGSTAVTAGATATYTISAHSPLQTVHGIAHPLPQHPLVQVLPGMAVQT